MADSTPRDRRQMIEQVQREFGLSIGTAGRLVAIGADAGDREASASQAVKDAYATALARGEAWALAGFTLLALLLTVTAVYALTSP
ncbi:hypothetical protein ACFYUY_01420 [Kitasatospora sp. NPDC004745]|uniref:hypothetical protein n=1 Tax=Kitasatospora sp. NPDC004745 TaxID=3364019 RepID=UPI0036921B20